MNILPSGKSAYSENYKLAKASINTMLLPDLPIEEINKSESSPILDINKRFYEKRVKSPTSATIAYSDAINDTFKDLNNRQIELYNANLAKLRSNPQIAKLIEEYNSKIDTLYPKSKDYRQALIAENRFTIGKTKPKLNQWQKLKFVLKYMY